MIYTGNYKNFKDTKYKTISISEDRGINENYKGLSYPKLAPKEKILKTWFDNKEKISEEENNKLYIQEYYKQVLFELDPEVIYEKLDNRILLCYEKPNEFCHRHIISSWFELFLGKEINEVKIENNELIEIEKPTYIKEILEKVIKENLNIKDFNSLEAFYLTKKVTRMEKSISEIIKTNPNKIRELTNIAWEIFITKSKIKEIETQLQTKNLKKVKN